jgi:cyclopropane-fatty-acyl-phospholipid synthase
LSEEQLKVSRERAEKSGLARSVNFDLVDYRSLDGKFDRIVSVGMFEHVGVNHYRAFFRKIYELLADDGVAVIHSIGRFDGPGTTNAFIAKYIFPGGYIPALSEVFPAIERERLISTDVEILRLHYAITLRHWRQRFRAAWHTLSERFGEKFCRIWEFYLAGSETAFRYQGLMVFQIQLSKNQEALPLTRDYMVDTERELRGTGSGALKRPARSAK